MDNPFFEQPILNSPYAGPSRHWELDAQGQPTQKIIQTRRPAEFITPIPQPKKRKGQPQQQDLLFDEGQGLSSQDQRYAHTAIINGVREQVDRWRLLPEHQWRVTPETARLLKHWRHHPFSGIRPFFCQVEAVETAIWLVEVAPQVGKLGQRLFNVEYADVLGIPFDFTAKPTVAPPQPPRKSIQVKAMRPERDHLEIRFPRVAGYRVELPNQRLTADFSDDSCLELTPALVGPSKTRNAGIIGAAVDLDLKHLDQVRHSTLLMHLTKHLILTQWRDPGEPPRLHLFGQLKRITRQWLDGYLDCKGGTYPALLMYQELADMACERIAAAVTRAGMQAALPEQRPIKPVLDPYNPEGSTRHVNFSTSKEDRWQTDPARCHINWAMLDSGWEAELCRVLESHPRVRAYVKNHNLGFEVPYRMGSETRRYLPDFIVLIDDGTKDQPRAGDDPLHLIIEVKGYRGEDAKAKKETMDSYWIPGVNNHGGFGRWAFAEMTDVWEMEEGLQEKLCENFNVLLSEKVNHGDTENTENTEKMK